MAKNKILETMKEMQKNSHEQLVVFEGLRPKGHTNRILREVSYWIQCPKSMFGGSLIRGVLVHLIQIRKDLNLFTFFICF